MAVKKRKKTSEKTVDISEVVKTVQIDRIFLVESSARRNVEDPRKYRQVDLIIAHNAHLHGRENNRFVVHAPIRVTVKEPENNEELVRAKVMLQISYSLPEQVSDGISDEQLEAFAQLNGTFNAWPYWREYVHQVFQRMELPSIVLPLYRKPAVSKTARAKAAKSKTVRPSKKKTSRERGKRNGSVR